MSGPDHILIVEDEPITREQLVAYFEEEGSRVSSTGSGDEVQKIIATIHGTGYLFTPEVA